MDNQTPSTVVRKIQINFDRKKKPKLQDPTTCYVSQKESMGMVSDLIDQVSLHVPIAPITIYSNEFSIKNKELVIENQGADSQKNNFEANTSMSNTY